MILILQLQQSKEYLKYEDFSFFFQNNELNIKVGANYFLSVHSLLQSYTTVLTSLSSPPVSPAAPPCRLPVRSLSSTQKGCWSPFLEDIPQSTGLPLCLHRTLCSGGCWSEERQDTHLFYATVWERCYKDKLQRAVRCLLTVMGRGDQSHAGSELYMYDVM